MKIRDLFRRSEKRTETLAEWDARLDAQASGGSGLPGARFMSDTMAMNLASVFNAAEIRTNYLAMPPLPTYYTDGEKKEKFKGSPIYSLLHDKPNPLMTSFSWRKTMELHAIFYGGGFSRIERDVLGRPIWLWLLDAKRMKAELVDNGRRLIWKYRQLNGGQDITYPDADIIHIPGLAYDGINGEGVIKLAASSLSLAAQAEAFGESFFANGMNAGGVFQLPNTLSDEAFKHLKDSIAENNSGMRNAHKPLILEDGLTWNKITFSPEEAQFMATRQFQDVEVARWFNLPLRMLKMPDASGLRNVEQISIEMVQGTMLPRYIAWEQELNAKLFADAGGRSSSRYCEFNVDMLLRGDSITRAMVRNIQRLAGIINRDEWRTSENMNPTGGPDGVEYWTQPNLAANKTNGETTEGVVDPMLEVQKTALNGAQMTALAAIVQAVADKMMPIDAAVELVLMSLPGIDRATALKMLKPAEDFEPKAPEDEPPAEEEPDDTEGQDDSANA